MKKSKAWFSSLSVRSIAQLTGVGLFIAALISGNAIVHQQRIVIAEMEQRGALLGESLGNACSLPYFLGDKQTVRYILSKAASIQDVLSVELVDREGKVEFNTSPPSGKDGELAPSRLGAGQLKVWNDHDSIQVLAPLKIERQASAMEQMLDTASPSSGGEAQNEILGHLYIRLSPARARQLARDFIWRSILFTLAAILLGNGAAFLLLRKTVLNPIGRLVAAMSATRQGNLQAMPEGRGSADEIGILIRAFNEMALALRKSEEDLKRANSELEQRVTERTMDLAKANKELQATQEKVIRSEKLAAVGQLASSVGHELRNPLAAISNAVYYLRDSIKGTPLASQDPSLVEFLDLADREVRSATHIIHDLLDFSRVPKLTLQPTDINALLAEAEKMIEIPPNVHVIEGFGSGLQAVTVDREKMRQVFMNLIQNAVQAMPAGGDLRLSTKITNDALNSNRQVVIVEVRDTGTGIKEEDLKKIFEPLFTTKAKGTGLGLPICLGIVQKHGGEILVSSKTGEGTAFTVYLPGGSVQP